MFSWLNLRYNAIGDEGGIALARSLHKNPNSALLSLDLWNNNLGERAGIAFGALLRDNPNLTTLNLRGNPIHERGGHAMGLGLGKRTSFIVVGNLQLRGEEKEGID